MCLFPSGYTHALKIVIEILIFERSLKMKHQKKPNSNLDFFKDNNHRPQRNANCRIQRLSTALW